MSKKKLLILGIIGLLLTGIFVVNRTEKQTNIESGKNGTEEPTPTIAAGSFNYDPTIDTIPNFLPSPAVKPTGQFFPTPTPNENGEIVVPDIIIPTLPPEEQKIVNAIVELREKVPVKTDDFVVDYDYHINKFTVKFLGTKTEEKLNKFKEWLLSNNYNVIPSEYWEYLN